MTIGELKKDLAQALLGIYDRREAGTIAHLLVENMMNMSRTDQLLQQQEGVAGFIQERAKQLLTRLLRHEPIQYVLGESWFYGAKYYVNQSVLIPRPETEELVERIVKRYREQSLRILDIGTGSGCIAVSLQKHLPLCEVWGIDVSGSALQVAQKNAENLHVSPILREMDFLDRANWDDFLPFDVIVSNPPYITKQEFEKLDANVKDHEPDIALIAQDDDPFIFYKAIAEFAQERMKPGAEIFLELNAAHAQTIAALYQDMQSVELISDMQDKPRMLYILK